MVIIANNTGSPGLGEDPDNLATSSRRAGVGALRLLRQMQPSPSVSSSNNAEGQKKRTTTTARENLPELKYGKARQHKEKKKRKVSHAFVRFLIVASLGSVVALKMYLLLFVIDIVVGVYGVLTTTLIFLAFLLAYTKYKDPIVEEKNDDNTTKGKQNYKEEELLQSLSSMPLVSILIPVKNESEHVLRQAVSSSLNSSYQNLEVIVINDGSTDNHQTAKTLDKLQSENPKLKVIHLPQNMGKRRAICAGIAQGSAEGEIIIFVDSDSTIERTSIEKLVSIFLKDPDVGAVTALGRATNAQENALTKMQDAWYDGQFSIMKAMESAYGTVTCCSGMLTAYRREAILPYLDAWANDKFLGVEFRPGDDRHLTSFIIGGGRYHVNKSDKIWKAKYSDSAKVSTQVPSSISTLIKQQIRWKKSWVRIFLFNAPFYYKDRPAIAAFYYYAQVILSIVSPFIAFRNLVVLPLAGDYTTPLVFFAGLVFIGLVYAAEFRLRNPNSGSRWAYRILMTLTGTFLLSFLLYYALATIKSKSWLTR